MSVLVLVVTGMVVCPWGGLGVGCVWVARCGSVRPVGVGVPRRRLLWGGAAGGQAFGEGGDCVRGCGDGGASPGVGVSGLGEQAVDLLGSQHCGACGQPGHQAGDVQDGDGVGGGGDGQVGCDQAHHGVHGYGVRGHGPGGNGGWQCGGQAFADGGGVAAGVFQVRFPVAVEVEGVPAFDADPGVAVVSWC